MSRTAKAIGHVIASSLRLAVRTALAIPSPCLMAMGPASYGPPERRYVALRRAGKVQEAFPGADAWMDQSLEDAFGKPRRQA